MEEAFTIAENRTTVPATPVPALSMIVPTYNERTRVAELIDAVLAVYDAHGIDGELVIVDDNSPDGTGAIADEAAGRCGSRVRVLHRSGKLGLGTAVMAGFVSASAPVLGVMDADFSHPPERLPACTRSYSAT